PLLEVRQDNSLRFALLRRNVSFQGDDRFALEERVLEERLVDDEIRDPLARSIVRVGWRGSRQRAVENGDRILQILSQRPLRVGAEGSSDAGQGGQQQASPRKGHPPTHRSPPSSEQGRCRMASSTPASSVVRVRPLAHFFTTGGGVLCCSIFSNS